jgi:transposase
LLIYSLTMADQLKPAFRLALITVLQFLEELPDRQAADAVRGRIDWKYALGLELTDPGFDATVLCEFRKRLVEGGAEQVLLDAILNVFKERGWLRITTTSAYRLDPREPRKYERSID